MSTTSNESIVARGEAAALRVWRDEEPTTEKPEETRPYETLGYVISGSVDLTVDGKTTTLRAGDAYTVPKNAAHRYVVRERLTAVESISPAP